MRTAWGGAHLEGCEISQSELYTHIPINYAENAVAVNLPGVLARAGQENKHLTRAKVRASAAAPTKDRQFVTALARGLKLLECFTPEQPELSGSELARLTKLPQPTVWRLCHTMLELGILVPAPGDKLRPGLAVLRLGHSAIAGLGIPELARPHLQELANTVSGAAGLAMRDGGDMVFLQRCESDSRLLMSLRTGSRVPLSISALGWAWLVGVPEAERVRAIAELEVKDAARWATAKREFAKALTEYRTHGWIINAGVLHKGYNTVAVPVVAPDGSVPYTVNCGSAAATLSVARLRAEVGPRLREIAQMLRHGLSPQELRPKVA
jgi:DNA-binding IclR family transcriptional regulator